MISFMPSILLWLLSTVRRAPPSNAPILVDLRIEGLKETIFEGIVPTRGHYVSTVSGGRHHCDGTNGNANPSPGPTCTSALDHASRIARFPWDGTFSQTYDDYFITSIGPVSTISQSWSILLNSHEINVGGCQQIVKYADSVLFAEDAFNKTHVLWLSGPDHTRVHQPVDLKVVDSSTGNPISGATVSGQTSDASGIVSVAFVNIGPYSLKAERDDSIRSNSLKILVLP